MLRVRASQVLDGDRVRPGAVVVIDDGRVLGVEERGDADVAWDGWLVPGFVDTHTHGAAGADYGDPATDPLTALAAARRHGATTVVASLATGEAGTTAARVDALAALVRAGELAGIHLEGPCLAPGARGAHAERLLRTPADGALVPLLEAGGDAIVMVTLAPELPGGLAAVEDLVGRGIVVAVGHTAGDAATTRAAVERGASVATHLFNAMPAIHHREPGPVPVLLDDQRVTVELIADGVHVHPEVLRLAVRAAGEERVSLVTDAMAAAALGDGDYSLGALTARVRDGVARVLLPGDGAGPATGAIAGSTLTMARAHEVMAASVGVGVTAASRMAATNPARALGLTDVGRLAPGLRADLCLLAPDGALAAVMRHGSWVVAPPAGPRAQ